jgi:hypothetical protein
MIRLITTKALKRARHAVVRDRGEGGQALLLVLVVVFLLASLGAGLVASVTQELPFVSVATSEHAAYAALEAGVQNYRNDLNHDPTYYTYGTTAPVDAANPSMGTNTITGGACADAAGNGWEQICVQGSSGQQCTTPCESFHVQANTNFLGSTAAAETFPNEVLTTITGRAGIPKHYIFESAVVAFKKYATYLQNAYYSDTEVLDPNYPATTSSSTAIADPNVSESLTQNGVTTTSSSPESQVLINYTYTSDADVQVPVDSVPLNTALCDYEGYQENNFIDSLGTQSPSAAIAGQTDFSYQYPYYGPYYGIPPAASKLSGGTGNPSTQSSGFTQAALTYTFTPVTGESETLTIPASPCATPYDFIGGESFSGPVFSKDELHVCDSTGDPAFNGSPYSLLTATPNDIAFKYEWPGSEKGTGAEAGEWVPAGVTIDQVNCAGSSAGVPALAHGPIQLDQNEVLPQFDDSLEGWADGVNSASTPTYGCLYTGPTMIELVYKAGAEYMDVWSPLSKKTDYSGTGTNCGGNGTFSPTNPLIKDIPMPADGVIYVQNVPQPVENVSGAYVCVDPNCWTDAALDALNSATSVCTTGATCSTTTDGTTGAGTTCFLNPEASTALPDSADCTGGNLFVEGELNGELTIGADNNIYITRDLTYSCADTGGTLQSPLNGLPAACASETTPDVLGLYANGDVLFSHPVQASTCSGSGTTETCTNDSQCPNNGTVAADTMANVTPTCDTGTTSTGAVVDALLIALNGSFGIQNYNVGAQLGGMYVNGSDVAEYRGPFANTGVSGYTKQFTYDTRLAYLAPPDAVTASADNWFPAGWVNCGGVNLSASTTPKCTNAG